MTQRNIRLVEFKDDEIYSPSKSAEGTNAYYCDFCNFAGYRPAYASCLNRINNGCNGSLESSCATAISQGYCMALGMQKNETQEGQALYYTNRNKLRQHQEESAEAMGIRLGKRVEIGLKSSGQMMTRSEKNVPQGIPHSPEFKTAPTLADAINKKVRQLAKDEAIAKTSKDSTSTSKDESVLSKKLVSGDLSTTKTPTPPINTEGLSLLEIARLRKQQALNA